MVMTKKQLRAAWQAFQNKMQALRKRQRQTLAQYQLEMDQEDIQEIKNAIKDTNK